MEFRNIIFSKSEGIATIKFNRPDTLNSLSIATWKELNASLDDVEADNGVKAVIITGTGKAFSAGDDIAEFGEIAKSPESIKSFVRLVTENLVRVEKLSKPVIVAVNGLAMGGGCELALASDIIIASDNATFGLPEGLIGAIAGFAVDRLPKLIGTKKAAELLLTCDPIDAVEAHRLGIVNKIVSLEDLETEAIAMARRITRVAPLSASFTKKLVNDTRGEFDIGKCIDVASTLLSSKDFREGFAAFNGKRAPVFKGK